MNIRKYAREMNYLYSQNEKGGIPERQGPKHKRHLNICFRENASH